MTDTDIDTAPERLDRARRIALAIGFVLVVIGMLNNLPVFPGLEEGLRSLTGIDGLRVGRFPYQYLFPLALVLMLTAVALQHSFFRDARRLGRSAPMCGAALAIDIALVLAAVAVALAYLNEISSVCLIDQVTGARAQLIADALARETEFARLYGLPVPTSVDDPACVATLGLWLLPLVGIAVSIFLIYNIHVWGLPLVMVAIAMAAYTIITILVWYIHGPEGLNRYAYTMLGGEPRMLTDGLPNIRDALVNNSAGLLGRFMNILLTTVFPYILLGSLFGVSAGGQALIKIAFLWTRRLRGGPAHAAIISSAMFGTISGGPVVNVMSTGVLTIPMMLKRGFSKTFAGGIEAAASSGGQIMPPVMGVAAFILASMTNVPYSEVIVAALIPAVAFFGALFLAVLFQARKQGIEAVGQVTEDMRLTRDDWLNLVMIALPILVILVLLLTPKETVGCGLMGTLLGVERIATETGCRVTELPWLMQVFRNSAGSSGAAGWWACMILIALFFLDRDIRRHPGRLLRAFAEAGVSISGLYLMFLAVSVVDFCLNLTGLSGFIARDFLALLQDFGGLIHEAGLFFFVALMVTMLLAVLLGMGMPSVPAYINVALIMGPLLSGLGISIFTANMFIFYFAVASSITPPIAVAAFAAATITKADPMRTGFAAVRLGIVMFVIPFIFCYYPELLLIEPAQLSPAGGAAPYLPGYDGTVHVVPLALLIGRLAFGLYLLASAVARFDHKALSLTETGLRLLLAALVMATPVAVYGPALIVGAAVIAWHYRGAFAHRAAAG